MANIPASPMTSRVARPSQARTSIVVGWGVSGFEVGCTDDELSFTTSLGEWIVEGGIGHGETDWG